MHGICGLPPYNWFQLITSNRTDLRMYVCACPEGEHLGLTLRTSDN
ncbi:MAG: hypothetical protein H6Q79_1621 [Deltaproteobacteria bacterium]|nr:hypothetical protein [Deltaproteobacteria bacterium]MBP2686250.1 hypothetical protein [Deltaproteobacteria bacterium]